MRFITPESPSALVKGSLAYAWLKPILNLMKHEGMPAQIDLLEDPANVPTLNLEYDKPQDECGVLAIYSPNTPIGEIAYRSLRRLQHRGQSGAGVAYPIDSETLMIHNGSGLIQDAIPEIVTHDDRVSPMDAAGAKMAILHARYSTAESNEAFQPFWGQKNFALAHNGHIETIDQTAREFGVEPLGAVSDSWLLTKIIDKRMHELDDLEEAIADVAPKLEGAYSLVITDGHKIIGVRDPWGTHPLVLGRMPSGGYMLASETVAFAPADAQYVRDIEPGEIITINEQGISSASIERQEPRRECMFEYGYIARPEGEVNSVDVYNARKLMGKYLAVDYPVDADIVVGVPNSGLSAAQGYSEVSGLPIVPGLFKNDYVARSFIERGTNREKILQEKLTVNKAEVKGKRVVLVDDSLIKGNTMKGLVRMLLHPENGGAEEVHIRLAMPRYEHPCYGGMDTREVHRLVARGRTNEEIATDERVGVGADSVEFNSVERVEQAVEKARARIRSIGSKLCTACATGKYPYKVPHENVDLVELATANSA